MRSFAIKTFIDHETRKVTFGVHSLIAGTYYKYYDITGNEKKQKSLLKLLQSEHVKYDRFYGKSKGWCPVPEEFSYYLIEIKS